MLEPTTRPADDHNRAAGKGAAAPRSPGKVSLAERRLQKGFAAGPSREHRASRPSPLRSATKLTFPESTWRLEPTRTIQEVFDRVQSGQARYGVVPFENSTYGTISSTLDGLADRAGAYADILVCDEVYLDVHHFLLGRIPPAPPQGPSASSRSQSQSQAETPKRTPLYPLQHIRRVYSHPQALGQTARFLAKHLPHAETVEVSSTSRGAALAAEDPEGASAAVAGESAGRAAGLDVLARWIEDMEENATRFFVLRRREDGDGLGQGSKEEEEEEEAGAAARGGDGRPYAEGRYKSLVSFTVPHRRPGALADVLDCFRARGVNLTSINSVPSLAAPFQYLFFVEFEGSRLDDPEGRVRGVLEDLGRAAEKWRWLGSWRNRKPVRLTRHHPRHAAFSSSHPPPEPSTSRSFDRQSYLDDAISKFKDQKPTLIYDTLTPTNSHLLTLSLADHVPSLFPSYQPGSPIPYPVKNCKPVHPVAEGFPLLLPQGHHLVYFPLQLPPSQLMPDGTDPAHCPGEPFVRRVWAGGSVVFHPEWREVMRMDGRKMVCVEEVVPDSVFFRSDGKLVVEVRRRYGMAKEMLSKANDRLATKWQEKVAVEEVRRLVFLREWKGVDEGGGEPPKSKSKVVKPPRGPEFKFSLTPDATLLFHFSALSYNAHAIHIDPAYTRRCEGYKDLLVHGPLTLVLMLSALRACLQMISPAKRPTGMLPPYVRSLDYRNVVPLYVNEPLTVCLRRAGRPPASPSAAQDSGGKSGDLAWDVWIEGPEGGLAVKGQAVTGSWKSSDGTD
ncbi:hypothetical protein VTJ49DRAFT_3141 [Mycothermus thermophilus]|uniref:Prephenate dehydratase n=1 Tax=Humicola insolens TaxID=85995 RepID=A0ABR3V8B4_HUMIN